MKKLILIVICLSLFPATYEASDNNPSANTDLTGKKQKKKKSLKKIKSKKNYSQSNGCTYQGHTLIVGKRGGCYYMSGNSKEYVDRSYCSACN